MTRIDSASILNPETASVVDSRRDLFIRLMSRGFEGICVGRAVMGKKCFFIDLNITRIGVRDGVIFDGYTLPSSSVMTGRTIHGVGNHITQRAPRVLKELLAQSLEHHDNHKNITSLYSLYVAQNENSLTSEDYNALCHHINNTTVQNTTAPNTILSTSLIPRPSIGDVLAVPPHSGIDKGMSRSIFGRMVPQMNLCKVYRVVERADATRPAEFADKWEITKQTLLEKDETKDSLQCCRKVNTFGVAFTERLITIKHSHATAVAKGKKRLGHAGRFHAFAQFILREIVPDTQRDVCVQRPLIIDVAGGGGKLSCELVIRGCECVIVDPRTVSSKELIKTMMLVRKQKRHRDNTIAYYQHCRIENNADAPNGTPTPSDQLCNTTILTNMNDDCSINSENNNNNHSNSTVENEMLHITFERCLFEATPSDETVNDNTGNNSSSDNIIHMGAVVSRSTTILGLHCDGAVNAIIKAACFHKKRFAIVACCVFPTIFPRVLIDGTTVIERYELNTWIIEECQRLGYNGVIKRVIVPGMTGANECVYGIPN